MLHKFFLRIIGRKLKILHICHTKQSFLIVLITSIEKNLPLLRVNPEIILKRYKKTKMIKIIK